MRQFVGTLIIVAIGLTGRPSAAQTESKSPVEAPAPVDSEREAKWAAKVAALEAELALTEARLRSANLERIKAAETISRIMKAGETGSQPDRERALQDAIEANRSQVHDMQLKMLQLTSNSGGMATALANARERVLTLERELDRYQSLDAEKASKTKVEGAVETPARQLVEIAVGMDDGVKRGMIMDVLRDGKLIGRIKVLYTSTHTSVGEELSEFKKAEIGKDDRVVTRTE